MNRCEACGRPCATPVTCNACEVQRIRGLLQSPAWLRVRGATAGDRAGETLADTMRRRLAELAVA